MREGPFGIDDRCKNESVIFIPLTPSQHTAKKKYRKCTKRLRYLTENRTSWGK